MDNKSLPAAIPLNIGLFLISACVLALELLSMRLLSFMLWHHLAYVVLSVAMLGFGASGAYLAAKRNIANTKNLLVVSAVLFALTSLLGFVVLVHVQLDTFEIGYSKLLKLGLYYAILFIPYFFAGLAIAAIFRQASEKTTSLYFINLVGSGVGCHLYMVIIAPFGGPGALIVISCVASITAVLWSLKGSKRLMTAAVLSLVVCAAALPFADRLLPIKPAATKGLAVFMTHPGAEIEFTEWTPLSRIDVGHAEEAPNPFLRTWVLGDFMRTITIDGDANTWIFNYKSLAEDLKKNPDKPDTELLKKTPLALAFLTKDKPETLIVGVGGGNEVATALGARAKHVTGVELNSAILDQTTKNLAGFFGNLYESGRASAVVAEGRSYVRRSDKRYDVIQMSGVDTWTGLSSGAYVLSENYLYTVEATKDFLSHLNPDGYLSIARYVMTPPRESLRLVSNALRALREMGAEEPEKHIMIMTRGYIIMSRLLVKPTPFTREEVDFYHRLLTEEKLYNDQLWYAPYIEDKLTETPFTEFVEAFKKGPEAEQAFYDEYVYDVTPVYDDRPFFFEYYKWKNLFRNTAEAGYGGQTGARRPIALMILAFLIAQVAVLCLVFIFIPLLIMRRRGSAFPHKLPIVLGFGSLGLAFMFLEVGFMQKFVLFLGHPMYSISISLFAVLVGSGLGSFVAGRLTFPVEKRILFSIVAILLLTVCYLIILDPLFDSLLGLPMLARKVIATILVAVFAFPMGMPFPLSLQRASKLGPSVVPWALGINGATSVLGGILCIVVAMSAGFQIVITLAALLYLLALPFLLYLAKRTS